MAIFAVRLFSIKSKEPSNRQRQKDFMQDLPTAARQTAEVMKLLTTTGGLRLKYKIVAGPGAADPDGLEDRLIYVDIDGPDAELLLDREGEALRALEHLAAKIIGLEPEEHDRISFDALGFKAGRAADLREMAERGVRYVRERERPFSYDPMSSRERRLLHLLLKEHEDLRTESSGEGSPRFVVLYPKNMPARTNDSSRAQEIAKRFRRR